MTDSEPFRRRIDRVISDDFLDSLASRTPAEVRSMRDDCREEEARLSYARRLLHGQLDIAKAELHRRGSGTESSLVTTLSQILADQPSGGPVRSVGNAEIYSPSGPLGRRRGDRVLDEVPLSRLPDLTDDELVTVVTRLAQEEEAISAMRRTVLDHLDRLQSELIARYRDGAASVHEVVPRPSP
ncbi:MAG: hypothetical protein ACR2HR_10920 [Euzebya sp.]